MSLQFEGHGETWQFLESIDEVPSDEWNQLVDPDQPFLKHEFLCALEMSQSVSAETGWQPRHYVCRDSRGQLVSAAPMYEKSHSYGEYVFDWSWADAYQRNGLNYYPKLLNAVPFTPCQGPRLLTKAESPAAKPQSGAIVLADAMERYQQRCIAFCQSQKLSSMHILFPEQEAINSALDDRAWLQRQGVQYHWYNRSYLSFDDFLAGLTSRRRKMIKKERAKVSCAGLDIQWLSGGEMKEEHLERFYTLYASTYLKRGQHPYLSLDFFRRLSTSMPESMQFVCVYRAEDANTAEDMVAGALFFAGTETLYGRYWGCLEEYDALHFEVCYYQGIEKCINDGLTHFDAGAQGEHKLVRGFEPVKTRSYHYISEPIFRDAIADFLRQEAPYVSAHMSQAKGMLPFKQELSGS